jgi:hypothetical protein
VLQSRLVSSQPEPDVHSWGHVTAPVLQLVVPVQSTTQAHELPQSTPTEPTTGPERQELLPVHSTSHACLPHSMPLHDVFPVHSISQSELFVQSMPARHAPAVSHLIVHE